MSWWRALLGDLPKRIFKDHGTTTEGGAVAVFDALINRHRFMAFGREYERRWFVLPVPFWREERDFDLIGARRIGWWFPVYAIAESEARWVWVPTHATAVYP